MKFKVILACITFGALVSCGTKETAQEKKNTHQGILPKVSNLTPTDNVSSRLNTFGEFRLTSDISHLSKEEKEALPILFEAANLIEDLFWKQTIGDKENFLNAITDETAKKFALINYGPWDRLDNNKPFFKEIGEKPKGANFYPEDMTKEEFEKCTDPNKTNLYTLIRRNDKGELESVWYHDAYADHLKKISDLLKKAADIITNPEFKNYLLLRADALLNSHYRESDFAWMESNDSNIDIVIGPIENYEDALFGYKTAFESFILIRDPEWSARLSKYSAMLPELQKQLPVKDEYKKEVPGSNSFINAYDAIYYMGDCNAGGKTIAINLPNDEEVHLKYGTKKFMLKNSMQAKFESIVLPISDILITPSQRKYVKFNAFFENTMFHEVGHAMGIKNTLTNKGAVRTALKEQYSAIEEAKADIMGLFLVTKLYDNGVLTAGELKDNYTTFCAGIFRSARFGAASAHGKANMLCFNHFLTTKAFSKDKGGFYVIDFNQMRKSVESLMQKILYIQGDGDYDAAKLLIEEEGIVTPQLRKDLDIVNKTDIPVDVVFDQGLQNIIKK